MQASCQDRSLGEGAEILQVAIDPEGDDCILQGEEWKFEESGGVAPWS